MHGAFQQKTPPVFILPKSAASQQHGQKPAPRSALPSVTLSFQPRPGHF